MNKVTKFYLYNAEYYVEIDGEEAKLLLNYKDNAYKVLGKENERMRDIARQLLSKKHGVNFAYKFDDRIEEKL